MSLIFSSSSLWREIKTEHTTTQKAHFNHPLRLNVQCKLLNHIYFGEIFEQQRINTMRSIKKKSWFFILKNHYDTDDTYCETYHRAKENVRP